MSRKYYNNGTEQALYEIGEQPEGWVLGKLTTTTEDTVAEEIVETNEVVEEVTNETIENEIVTSGYVDEVEIDEQDNEVEENEEEIELSEEETERINETVDNIVTEIRKFYPYSRQKGKIIRREF